MKKLILLFFCLLWLYTSYSQKQGQEKNDSLRAILNTAKGDSNKVKALYTYARALEISARDSSIYFFHQALDLSKKIDFKRGIVEIYGGLARHHAVYASRDSAILYSLSRLELARELNDSGNMSRGYEMLSYIERHLYNNNLKYSSEKGLSYIDSAIAYANNTKDLSQAYRRKSEIYAEQGNYNEAKYFIRKANDSTDFHLILALAYVLGESGQADSALTIYTSVLERNKLNPEFDDRFLSYTYSQMARAYMNLKKYNLAIKHAETGLKVALENKLNKELLDNLSILYEIYNNKKNFEKALYYFKWRRDYSDSLNINLLKSSDTRHEDQVNAERDQQQILLLEKENEKQRLVRNGFVGGFSVVLLFAGVFLRQRNKTKKEMLRSDELLLNILPGEVADEIKASGAAKAKAYTMVTVMFTDFKDFTTVSEKVSAELLVDEIHTCFSAFDNILHKHRIEKIKTIGDAYLCASGLPVSNYTHAVDMLNAAFEIRSFMLERKKEKETKGEIPFELRIGIHTGPIVAGVVGVKKYAYDIWGDTVNIAARMEQNSEAGKVNISGSTYELVKDKFRCQHRGKIQAKNKGDIDMYFVEIDS